MGHKSVASFEHSLDTTGYAQPARLEPVVAGDRYVWAFVAAMQSIGLTPHAFERITQYFPPGTSVSQGSHSATPIVEERLSVADQIVDILRYLGLSKTQLKDICGVSRQTLYDWLAGKFDPDETKAERLRIIHAVAVEVPKHSKVAIAAALVTRESPTGPSLLQLLRQSKLDLPKLRAQVLDLARESAAIQDRSAKATGARLGFSEVGKADQRQNLDDNTDDLG